MHSTSTSPECFPALPKPTGTPAAKIVLSLVVFALALALCPGLYGQARGSFSGNIVDKAGSVVPGASVTVTAQSTGQVRAVKTDGAGHYDVPLLPFDTYNVRVDASGFDSTESKDLQLHVDEARELDFTLTPGTVVTTVNVSGTAVAVETANASLGQVITAQEVSQLPLNGRDFVQLATLTAGATSETNPGSFFTSGSDSEVAARGPFSLSVGGSRPNSSDWLLDGVDNNELTAGGIGIYSSIDDIQEFKVLTYTYSAEFGTRAGPTVLVTTKSGTNDLHGTLYEFVRNTDLDAKSYFDTTTAEKFNLNQFGGSIGGPIRRNKRFSSWMASRNISGKALPLPAWFLRWPCAAATSPPMPSAIRSPAWPLPIPIWWRVHDRRRSNVISSATASGHPIPANPDGSPGERHRLQQDSRQPDRHHWSGHDRTFIPRPTPTTLPSDTTT